MDVSTILAAQAERHQAVTVDKDIALDVDVGRLCVSDQNVIDEDEYKRDLESYLNSTARDSIQALISSLVSLPTQTTPDGPLSTLPTPKTHLPRAKPLPKPKPPTKWEKFAAAKGIQKQRKEKKVWDEEKQDWVDQWGWKGKNKEVETQWATEVKANADVDHNPSQAARDARKSRVAKNERQQLQNIARAEGKPTEREERKREIEKTLATTRVSTASMGKFDKKLEGEKKLKGVKRKFDPSEQSAESEKKASLALISKLDGTSKKSKREHAGGGGQDDVLNVRKAVRFASKGKGGVALGREKEGRGKGKPMRGRGGKGRR